jgi:hypothetical protein
MKCGSSYLNYTFIDFWRSRTQVKSYPREIVPQKLGTISPGEVVPGYDFSWRIRTWVRLLQEKSYPSLLGYEFSRRICTHQMLGTKSPGEKLSFSVIKYWVRLLRKKLCHFQSRIKLWVRVLFWKKLCHFSNKILGTSSPEKRLRHFQSQNCGYEFSFGKTLSFLVTKYWVRVFLVKNFVIYSYRILGMTSPEKKKTSQFLIIKFWVRVLRGKAY